MNKNLLGLLLFSILCVSLIHANLGEYSGEFNYSIVQGSSINATWTLINTNSTNSISFYIVPANLTKGSIYPNIVYKPLNGLIYPGNIFQINLSINMPNNAPLNITWSGYATAETLPNGSEGGQIAPGTAKLITLMAIASTTTSTTSSTTIAPTSTQYTTSIIQSEGGNPGSISVSSISLSSTTSTSSSSTTISDTISSTSISSSTTSNSTTSTNSTINSTTASTSIIANTTGTSNQKPNYTWLWALFGILIVLIIIIVAWRAYSIQGGSSF